MSLADASETLTPSRASPSAKVYTNAGNPLVAKLVPPTAMTILDVGCGAGDNARLLLNQSPSRRITGLTYSPTEARLAETVCETVHIADVTTVDPKRLGGPFDAIIFSHVLEHVAEPAIVFERLLPCLASRGAVIILVPNVLQWRTRWQFLRGRFEYTEFGVLDRTHLRFYTPQSAIAELVKPIAGVQLDNVAYNGSAPLGPFRRRLLPSAFRKWIDSAATNRWPTLFASEIALRVVRQNAA
jgi:SAM-dependent methyltransferase